MSIAFGAQVQTSVAGGTATATTGTITVTGSNTIGFVLIENQNVSGISSVTWNGVACTLIDSQQDPNVTIGYIYAILNPGTGVIAVTRSATTFNMAVFAPYYTGASQTLTMDATTKGSGAAASLTGTLTTIANNAWQVLVAYMDNGSIAASTGSTIRGTALVTNNMAMFDSNSPQTPAGSKSMSVTGGGGSNFNYVMVSFAPAPAASTSNSAFFAFM